MFVEQKVDFSRFVKDGFGTSDCIIIDNDTIFVIDFKYGTGVKVDALNNTQMMIYALGALEMFDGIFDISSLIYYITIAWLFLFFTVQAFEKRKWS